MRRLMEYIKRHKKLFFILLLLIIVSFVFWINGIPQPEPEIQLATPRVTYGTFSPESVYPPSGTRVETINNRLQIMFQFPEPIDLSTVKLSIEPQVNYTVETGFQDSTVLRIIPSSAGWVFDREYVVTITELYSVSGENITGPIDYSFTIVSLGPDAPEGF